MAAHDRHLHRIRARIQKVFGAPFPRPAAYALAGSCPGARLQAITTAYNLT